MNLEKDPEFLSDYLNGMIVQQLTQTMSNKGCSKTRLAELAGLSRMYIFELLTERKNITIHALVKICCALDCTVEVVIKKESQG